MPPNSLLAPLLNEVRVATDYIIFIYYIHCLAVLSLSIGMACTGVAQRHLWLTL